MGILATSDREGIPRAMRLVALLALAAVLVAPTAEAARRARGKRPTAAAQAPSQPRFLGKDPHGPLATVKAHRVVTPASASCRTWGHEGQVWQTLDRHGQVVGKARVSGMERYDVTNCDELHLEKITGQTGAEIYASAGYQAAAITPWKPAPREHQALAAIIRRRDASRKEPPLAERLLTWKAPDGATMAAVGGGQLSVLRLESGVWKTLYKYSPQGDRLFGRPTLTPRAALDMNGDGEVEIVVSENFGASFGDFTLTPSGQAYRRIEAAIHGSTA